MKEASGEVSMTVIVIVAVAVIGGILAAMWPSISATIKKSWGNTGKDACEAQTGCRWVEDASTGSSCVCSNK